MKFTGQSFWLGTNVEYVNAWGLQSNVVKGVLSKASPNTLLFLEHSAVYTVGRRFSENHLLGPLDAPLLHTDRGGQITYHGPGQLICYPIISLPEIGLGPKSFVKMLELSIIDTLKDLSVDAWTEEGLTGVWTSKGKIAAIGVKISRGITSHGFALNIDPDLKAYEPIIPCGILGRDITSIFSITGQITNTSQVCDLITKSISKWTGIDWGHRLDSSVETIQK